MVASSYVLLMFGLVSGVPEKKVSFAVICGKKEKKKKLNDKLLLAAFSKNHVHLHFMCSFAFRWRSILCIRLPVPLRTGTLCCLDGRLGYSAGLAGRPQEGNGGSTLAVT